MALDHSARRRIVAAILLAAAIGAGLVVRALLPDSAATDIAADALYAAAVYLGVVIAAPRLRPLAIGVISAAWCTAVELFQLTGIPLELGAAFPPSTLVFGTVFDARDLVVYVITAAVVGAADVAVSSRRSEIERVAD